MTARRIVLDELCPCGRRKYALMVPVFGYGNEGGTHDIAERGCEVPAAPRVTFAANGCRIRR